MLTLTFLGVGSAFAKRNFQSNALVEAWARGPNEQQQPDDQLLIDFGNTGPLALHALMQTPGFEYLNDSGRIRYSTIKRVFITHLHGDHIGGLEEMAVLNAQLHVPPALRVSHRAQLISIPSILSNLWERSLSGALRAQPGKFAELTDYFEVTGIDADRSGGAEGIMLMNRYSCHAIITDHVHVQTKLDCPSLGLRLVDQQTGESAVYSGDTRFDRNGLVPLMSNTQWNFHEVQFHAEGETVHTLLRELQTLPHEVRKRTVLYHYDDSWDSGRYDSVNSDFAGFANPRQRYVLFD